MGGGPYIVLTPWVIVCTGVAAVVFLDTKFIRIILGLVARQAAAAAAVAFKSSSSWISQTIFAGRPMQLLC